MVDCWKQSRLLNLLDHNRTGGSRRASFCPAIVWIHSLGTSFHSLKCNNALFLVWRNLHLEHGMVERIICLVGLQLIYHSTPFLCTVLRLVQPCPLAPPGCVCSTGFSYFQAAQRLALFTRMHLTLATTSTSCTVAWGE